MQISKLTLQNFQLFKKVEINFNKINLITGVNLDDLAASGNGSGKTTILNALLFVLYGNVTNLNLVDLIRIGEKECSVELECLQNNEHFRIIRKIPSNLQIFLNDNEIKFNTATIAQKYLDDLFGDVNNFKMYHMIDNLKGINLLDLGIISLRKNLMQLVDNYFNKIRQSLLTKKLERETYNGDKRLYKFCLSTKLLNLLENGLKQGLDISIQAQIEIDKQYNCYNNLLSEIQAIEKEIYYKQNEIKKAKEGICPILKIKCEKISQTLNFNDNAKNLEVSHEIEQLSQKIVQLKEQLEIEKDALNYYKNQKEILNKKERKTREYIIKLKESFKFKDYKYTLKDVQLYTDTIKVLDAFSAIYIQEWLNNLTLILNDLLKDLNISVEFSVDKSFMKVNNNGQELKYEQLSGGQRAFLNSVFKLAILLNNGINEGLILIDEGFERMDLINLKRFIEIVQNLNFQIIIIYQNLRFLEEIKNINYIETERKNDESKIK